ncbi:MAG: hypothetical protein Q8908_03855 [Bacteroidota bacterium]|nr:hypothetical protein [Bacteroidota bacterium]
MPNSNIDIISRKVVLFQSEILEMKKKVSDLLAEKTVFEREANSLRENLAEVRQENADLQEIVYDLNKENNHLKSRLEQLANTAATDISAMEPTAGTSTESDDLASKEPQTPDPLEQKRKEAELEKQLFEYERNSTIPDYFRFEADENNFDSEDQE